MATGSPCSASMEPATVSMATTTVAARMLERCNCCMVSGHSMNMDSIQQRGEIYSTICKGLKLHQQIRIINNFTQVKQTSQSFILQNNPLGFSNRRRLDRATDQSNFTLCLSQYKTDSSIPIGSPSSMSALLRIYSVTAETGERPGGHLAITQTTQGCAIVTISSSSSSSGSKGGGCAPPGAGEE